MKLFILAAAAAQTTTGGGIGGVVEQFGIDVPALIAQIISFSVVALVLYRYAFKPVLNTLDARQKRIEDGLRYADEMKAALADAEQQRAATIRAAAGEAQRIIDEARKSGKALLERQTQDAAEQSAQLLAKAEQAIVLERRKMLSEARSEIARLVLLTASRVLSRDLTPEERARFTESAGRELANV